MPQSGARRPDAGRRRRAAGRSGRAGRGTRGYAPHMKRGRMMLKQILFALAVVAAPLAVHAQRQAAPDFAAAVSAPGRPEAATKLDEVRRPAEVLRWLGLRRGDRVLDYFTGTGYYAEIMARAVGPTGSV